MRTILILVLASALHAAQAQQASYMREQSFRLPPKESALTVEEPSGLAVDAQGRIHILDRNGRVIVFSPAGELLHTYGETELERPMAAIAGAAGRMLILDSGRKQVVIYDATGQWLGSFGKGGDHGGEFSDPIDMARGPGGLLHILDKGRKCVQIFSPEGLFIRDVRPTELFEEPTAIAVTPDGMMYITDKQVKRRFYQLPPFNSLPWQALVPASCAKSVMLRGGELEEVTAIVANRFGTLFFLDQKTGKLWRRRPADEVAAGANDYLYGGLGDAFGSFDEAVGLACVGDDELLVLDKKIRKVERILLATEDGLAPMPAMRLALSASFGKPSVLDATLKGLDCTDVGVRHFFFAEEKVVLAHPAMTTDFTTSAGDPARGYEPDVGSLAMEYREELDSVGDVAMNDTWLVVSDPSKNRIAVYDRETGMLIGVLGDGYRDDRKFDDPQGVAISISGCIAVADKNTNHVRIISPDLASISSIDFQKPRGVACDRRDNIYVWAEDGTQLSLIAAGSQRCEPVRSKAFPPKIADMTFDPAGNFIVVDGESQRILVIDPAGEEVLFAFGPEKAYDEPSGVFADDRGNVYVADRKKKRTHIYHWSVSLPVPDRFKVTYFADGASLAWDECPSRYVTGYEVYGYAGPQAAEGVLLYRGERSDADLRLADLSGLIPAVARVASVGMTGMAGRPGRAIELPGLQALGLAPGADLSSAAGWAAHALEQIGASGPDSYSAEPDARDRLQLILFLNATDRGDPEAIIQSGTPLRQSVPDAQRARYGTVMARAHLAAGEPRTAADYLLGVVGAALPCEDLADSALISTTLAVYEANLAARDTATAAGFMREYARGIPDGCPRLQARYGEQVALLDLRALLAGGLAHWQAGDFAAAATVFGGMVVREAARLALEQRVMLYQLLAAAFYAQGDRERAREEYRKIFVLDPGFRLEGNLELIQRVNPEPIYDATMIEFFSGISAN